MLQRWRPIRKSDRLGRDANGMKHDQLTGEYYLARDADAEIRYLLSQLHDRGWTDYRRDDIR